MKGGRLGQRTNRASTEGLLTVAQVHALRTVAPLISDTSSRQQREDAAMAETEAGRARRERWEKRKNFQS